MYDHTVILFCVLPQQEPQLVAHRGNELENSTCPSFLLFSCSYLFAWPMSSPHKSTNRTQVLVSLSFGRRSSQNNPGVTEFVCLFILAGNLFRAGSRESGKKQGPKEAHPGVQQMLNKQTGVNRMALALDRISAPCWK